MKALWDTKKIQSMRKEQESIDKKIDQILVRRQKKCKHGTVCELPYERSDYGSSEPPCRVCVECGLNERGWSFQVLRDDNGEDFPLIKLNTYIKLRAPVGFIDDSRKSPRLDKVYPSGWYKDEDLEED